MRMFITEVKLVKLSLEELTETYFDSVVVARTWAAHVLDSHHTSSFVVAVPVEIPEVSL